MNRNLWLQRNTDPCNLNNGASTQIMKLTILCLALAISLTGCGDGGGDNPPAGPLIAPAGGSNPFQPAREDDPITSPTTTSPTTTSPTTTSPTTTNPTTTSPTTTNPTTTSPTTTNPTTPPNNTGSTSVPDTFYNGADENNFNTIWRCADVGATDPDNWFAMRFYTDMNGAYGGGGQIIEFSYTINADSVQIIFPGDGGIVQFTDMQFSGDYDLLTNLEAGGESSPISCSLIDLEGNPLGNDQTPGQQTQTEPSSPTANNPYSNGLDFDAFDNIWDCRLSQQDTTSFYLLLFDNMTGTFINPADDTSSNIEWSENAVGDLEYLETETSDQITHGNTRFEGNDTMLADTFLLNGQPATDNSGANISIQCFRVAASGE